MLQPLSELLDQKLWSIPVSDYLISASLFLSIVILAPMIIRALLNLLQKIVPDESFKDLIRNRSIRFYRWFYFVLAAMLATNSFPLPERVQFVINLVSTSLILIQILIISSKLIRFSVSKSSLGRDSDGHMTAINQNLASIMVIFVWALAFLILFDNFGFNVATLIAGLGVGGIAIGLALQTVLGDVFASFAIGLDKPFEIGDFVILGDFLGTVERVGLKTTRIRSLGGELLIFSNSDLINSRIRNYKKMRERRIVFKFGVTYDTDQSQLEDIPSTVKSIIDEVEGTRFDRAHFQQFGDFSLDFEVVYYVLNPDYNTYMDTQQKINFELRRRFIDAGISFAFPTRTIDFPAWEKSLNAPDRNPSEMQDRT
ncbi:mechanosensitive ion channel family protein [Pseudobacteriovorax antillogorgiicola]|uniref:Small-conductance mechanosensitive channel n=1 Tax=Pseudobacteriovorax antillogorgiicola TaxID=1513793 RepID=A0A1Y6CBW9_9BACT|nr:mechanosensitive ion channel family protein [Pseudobacteriovorax antillogorgiicola]TCS49357.1 small-conductance mechanosensitive channel [Pseudobacteriovorax antillogorgiicola]SMF47564.1 Small-conductance mechanosensitive channel [Pseudobacteriovorax antillogorgiicola]